MSNIAIQVDKLGKQYRIGRRERYRTFRDVLTTSVTAPFQRVSGLLKGNASAASNLTDTIWALREASFEVNQGEVVGIIGHNGAGKSTLLKILSRITDPTEGYAKIHGRVGTLLEVGTGFHPELTGRENVYLNGAILGMTRDQIERKFDEIVAFAEVEQFIDTPVKHYSSGMGLRLGFAVAAHLEPEILIVDEVLAVGDFAFQQKCMGKMGEVASTGRTVLFVSHNMESMQRLCKRIIILGKGHMIFDGESRKAIDLYYNQIIKSAKISDITLENTQIRDFDLAVNGLSVREHPTVSWDSTQPLRVSTHFVMKEPAPCPLVDISLFRKDGLKLVGIEGDRNSTRDNQDLQEEWDVTFELDDMMVSAQNVFIDFGVKKSSGEYIVHWRNAVDLAVINTGSSIVTGDSIMSPRIKVTNEVGVHNSQVKVR